MRRSIRILRRSIRRRGSIVQRGSCDWSGFAGIHTMRASDGWSLCVRVEGDG